MAYRRSFPLNRWFNERSQSLQVLADAHRRIGQIAAPGRPIERGRRLAHAYILQLVAEFQAFARELHDLGVQVLVRESGAQARHVGQLIAAATADRHLDRGNAGLNSLQRDYRRLGIADLNKRIKAIEPRWTADKKALQKLIDLRNALAHGNERELQDLRQEGILDTRSWAGRRRPCLNRLARALDHVLWEHFRAVLNKDPW